MFNPRVREYFKGERVLVTGGAGFIGSHLVEMLVELGALVTVPVRGTTSLQFLRGVESDIEVVNADLFDRSCVDRVLRGQSVVIHLAAAKGGGISHSMCHHGSLFRDNMLSCVHVIESARCASVRRLLVVSSACVYPRDAATPTPEEEGFRDSPEPTNAGYGWSKRMLEYLALSFVEEFAMNIGIARPFNAFGPRDDFFHKTNHVIPGLVTRVIDGEDPLVVWGSGEQTRSFLYVTDFARGLLELCAHENITGPVNIGGDEEVSIGELARQVVHLCGTGADICYDTSKPDGQPRRACDTSKAKDLIGFEAQMPLREGLRKTIDWYRAQIRVRDA